MLNPFKKKKKEISVSRPSKTTQLAGFNDFTQGGSFDGSKTYNLFGCTRDYSSPANVDYWTLRKRSRQIYTENMYAKTLIDRLNTNIIGKGLKLEAAPNRDLLDFTDEDYLKWTNKVEALWKMWSKDSSVCDYHRVQNFSSLQKSAFHESKMGDVLMIIRINRENMLPNIQLIKGDNIKTPFGVLNGLAKGHKVVDGVELDAQDRPLAYYVCDPDSAINPKNFKRITRFGPRSKRLIATLITSKPLDPGQTRSMPELASILEPLQQLGTYTDYELLAAKINASLVMVTRKTEDRPGSDPLGGVSVKTAESSVAPNLPLAPDITNFQPGLFTREQAYGEEIESFNTSRPNVNFDGFKKSILKSIAATAEVPPEIFDLEFQNNFSASRQASIEFGLKIDKEVPAFANQFNSIVYSAFLTSLVLSGIVKADGYIKSIQEGDIFTKNAWESANFIGSVKQSVDILKEARAYKIYVDEGWATRDQAALELTGTEYQKNVTQLKVENEQLAEANEAFFDDEGNNLNIDAGV